MQVTVIIAFRGEPTLLQWTLEGFAQQQLSPDVQLTVAVGGDGQDVPTFPASTSNIRFAAHRLDRIGAAAVRNALVAQHPCDILIFGNADARPDPAFVRTHIGTLTSLPPKHMVLGAAPWELPLKPTIFDALLAETPMIFFYHQLQPRQSYDFRHAWTLNLSVRHNDFVASGGFNVALRPVYYEDLSLGLRVCGPTAKTIHYQPEARVLHRHPTTLAQYLNREELLGLMAPVLWKHEPAAFAAIFGDKSADALAATFRTWVAMDLPTHRWIYQRLKEWAEKSATELPTDASTRSQLLMTIYQMHVPLKRLAFRLGFIRGMELLDPADWQSRTPTGLWQKVLSV